MEGAVLIVGGGIGGLATAVALRRVGVRADVFERTSAVQEVGAGLSLWSNAVKALRRLGVADAVLARASPIETAVTRTDRGEVLSEAPIGEQSRRAGAPSVCAHRADLQQALAAALGPDQIHLNATCTGVEADTDGVTARFADGRTARGAVLVGADGIRSVVRAGLHGPALPRYAGYFAYRGIGHGDFPELPPGCGEFGVGCGAQLGLFHCGPGRVYWFATVNGSAGGGGPGPHNAEAQKRFAGWFPPVPAVIAATEESALLRNDIIDRPPVWPWGRGRVTLLGDAVHPTTPNLGQGACMALEDAIVLADCLKRGGLSEAALREYEQARRRRTAMVTNQSWSLGKLFQLENRLAMALRDWLFRRQFSARRGEKLFDELLGYDVPELTA